MVYHRGFSLLSKLQYEAAQQLGFRRNSVRWLQVQALELHSELKELIPEQQERLKKLKSNPGKLYDIDVWMVLDGMRRKLLPTAKPGGEPLPEGLLWLLLTGKLPTKEQVDSLSKELRSRATVPDHVYKTIDALPINADQMTQFATGVMALQVQSEFQKAYDKGIHKSNYWEPTYEDALSLIAQLPLVASYVYRRTFKNGHVIVMDDSLDYGANFAHMLGFDDPAMQELMRLYITIHADHGGGNVSAHTGRLVASALSDPYLSFAAALNGLAGPLHGLANQEFLLWIKLLVKECGENVSEENLKDFVRKTLNSGKVVPGFGHRVLESTDPRYTCLREFALKHLPEDPLFKLAEFAQAEGRDPQLVRKSFEKGVSSEFLEICGSYGIWPNVNAHSGVLLNHYGLTEAGYHPVVFGVSRAIGICAQLIWDRALGLPLERPKSVTMEWLENYCKKTSFSSVI